MGIAGGGCDTLPKSESNFVAFKVILLWQTEHGQRATTRATLNRSPMEPELSQKLQSLGVLSLFQHGIWGIVRAL